MKLGTALIAGIVAASIGAYSGSACATLISANDPVFGVDSVTVDTVNNTQWLDLTITRNQSLSSIQSQLTTTYQGWRVATLAEAQTLALGAGIALENGSYQPVTNGPLAGFNVLTSLLGNTFLGVDSRYNGFFGTVADGPEAGRLWYLGAFILTASHINTGSMMSIQTNGANSTSDSYQSSFQGVFLVRSSNNMAVPGPGALALLGLGMMGLAWVRRRSAPV